MTKAEFLAAISGPEPSRQPVTPAGQRAAKAFEIIRRIDTVCLCSCREVEDIMGRALAGEFDGMEI